MVPLIEREVVDDSHWLAREDYYKTILLTQSVPGPIAVNTAFVVGRQVAGLSGGLISALGVVLPSFAIILVIAMNFASFQTLPVVEAVFRGIRTAVVALIAAAGVRLARESIELFTLVLAFAGLGALLFLNFEPVSAGAGVHCRRDRTGLHPAASDRLHLCRRLGCGIRRVRRVRRVRGGRPMMTLLQLSFSFLKIGLFSFGGGYAMLPLIQEEVVNLHGWITQANFVDIIAVAQITPGPIAVNSATFVGYHVAGIPGAVAATFSVVLGPLVLAAIVVRLADRFSSSYLVQGALAGLRPALLALIAYSAVSIARTSFTGVLTVLVGSAAFALLIFTRVHPLIVLGATALIGGLFLGG